MLRSVDGGNPYRGQRTRPIIAVECAECRTLSDGRWPGWAAYRIDEPGEDEPPELAFYCPDCRQKQFGVT